MKKTRYLLHLTGIMLALALFLGLGSCGTTRAHFGIEHDIAYNWDGGYYENPGHGPKHKKPKPPKHKDHHPKKHKKHGKHHD